MIAESILNLINDIVMYFFKDWEDIDLLISQSAFETVKDVFAFLFYILPMDGISVLFGLFVAMMGLRIVVATVKTIWELLPVL